MALLSPVLPPVAANDNNYGRRPLPPPDAMTNPGLPWLRHLVAGLLRTVRLPDNFIGALLTWFILTGPYGDPLQNELWKRGALHAFLGRLTAEALPVPRLHLRQRVRKI